MIGSTSSLDGVVGAILKSLAQWGGLIVFGTMFLDCLPFIAFAAPGVIMLVLTGFVAAKQPLAKAGLLFGSACTGVLLSDTLTYFVGRLGYGRVGFIQRIVDRRDKLRNEIRGQRVSILILYQFPPYSRMFAPLIMGAAGFSWSRWAVLVAASTLIFVTSFFGLGLMAGMGGNDAISATKAASVVSALFIFAFLGWLSGLVLSLLRRRSDARSPVR